MSHFKTVFDFMQGIPAGLKHEDIFHAYLDSQVGDIPEIDLVMWEESCIGIGERNILRDLNISDKFRCPGMGEEFELQTSSLAKQKGKTFGKGSLSKMASHKESFSSSKTILLKPKCGLVLSSGREGLVVKDNEPMYRNINSALQGISGLSFSGPAVSYLGESLVLRQDLRHLFLKGYLLLMSYNLAVVSDVVDYHYSELNFDLKTKCVGEKKLSCMLSYKIVVDVERFTGNEVRLLVEMSSAYPKRRYGKGNVYDKLCVGEDIMAFMTDKSSYDPGPNTGFGSPERLWNDLVSIACKMDAMEDLREVVRDFRGMPFMLKNVTSSTGKDMFSLKYPLSYSLNMGIEGLDSRNPFILRESGYFSTSKCLVADLLLGRMMELSAFNIIEEIGGLGDISVPSMDPMMDEMYNSQLRNWGLKSEREEQNRLLREWKGVRGCSLPLSFGPKLKDYVQRMTALLRLHGTGDVLRPQLLYSLPYSECRNTTWAVIRGWKFQEFAFRSNLEEKVLASLKLKAFTWVMGVGDSIPKLGMNALGAMQVELLTTAENEYILLAAGEYELGMVRHMISSPLYPRTDEVEMGMKAFYSTAFPGTRCTIIFDEHGAPKLVEEERWTYHIGTVGRESAVTYQEPYQTGIRYTTYGGSNYEPGGSKKVLSMHPHGEEAPRQAYMERRAPLGKGERRESKNYFYNERVHHYNDRVPNWRAPNPFANTGEALNDMPEKKGVSFSIPPGGEGLVSKKYEPIGKVPPPSRPVGGLGEPIPEGPRPKIIWSDEVDREMGDHPSGGEEIPPGGGEERPVELKRLDITQKGPLPFVGTPAVFNDKGEVIGVETQLVEGGTKTFKRVPYARELNPESFRGYRIKTPGDGTCGVHAIVEDLTIKGFNPDCNKRDVYLSVLEHLGAQSWQEPAQLAAALSNFSMGLVFIDGESKTIKEYGTKNSINNVMVYYADKHYETFIPHDEGPHRFSGFKLEKGQHSPHEQFMLYKELQKCMKSDYVADVMMKDCYEKMRRTATGYMEDVYQDAVPRKRSGKLKEGEMTPEQTKEFVEGVIGPAQGYGPDRRTSGKKPSKTSAFGRTMNREEPRGYQWYPGRGRSSSSSGPRGRGRRGRGEYFAGRGRGDESYHGPQPRGGGYMEEMYYEIPHGGGESPGRGFPMRDEGSGGDRSSPNDQGGAWLRKF